MENNLENKARFFAQYYGQNVKRSYLPEQTSLQVIDREVFWIGHLIINGYLELKPLEDITDEDFNLITNDGIMNPDPSIGDPVFTFEVGGLRLSDLTTTDFLRSKGYALPWMGLSVEKLVEYGWVKLKEKKDGK